MRVYRRQRGGKTYRRWTVEFRAPGGIQRRLSGFEDRRATEELGHKLQRLSDLVDAGREAPADLTRFVERLPAEMRERLASWRVIDSRQFAAAAPLVDHLAAYQQSLLDRGNTAAHAQQSRNRAQRILTAAGATHWSDVTAARVERALAAEREAGLSAAASNGALTACKAFVRWMLDRELATVDPLRRLRPVNARLDPRRERRALEPHELRALITATAAEPERYGMTGPARALLYRLASETGLRAAEIRSLTVAAFEGLDSNEPAVRLQAAYSKRRREDVVPLRVDTARALAALLRGMMPQAVPLPVPHKSAEMIRADLAAAGVEYQDAAGRVVDFHALRHGFITSLARGGVEPKVAQALARHSTITLTLDRYTHVRSGDQRRALDALPELDGDDAERSASG